MGIALDYLDTDHDGKIHQQDCPQLSQLLFSILDTQHKGEITRKTMNDAIMELATRIVSLYNRIQGIKKKGSTSDIQTLAAVEDDYHRHRQILREINQYLHQYFVLEVFNTISAQVTEKNIDLGIFQKHLNEIQSQIIMTVKPLSNESLFQLPTDELNNSTSVLPSSQSVLFRNALNDVTGEVNNEGACHSLGLLSQSDLIKSQNVLLTVESQEPAHLI